MTERFEFNGDTAIRSWVDRAGISQKVLALEAGVNQSWLSMLLTRVDENGSVRVDTPKAVRLLEVLERRHLLLNQVDVANDIGRVLKEITGAAGIQGSTLELPEAGMVVQLESPLYIRRDVDRRAIDAIARPSSVRLAIAGGPGTGKTSIVTHCVRRMKDLGASIVSCVGGQSILLSDCSTDVSVRKAVLDHCWATWRRQHEGVPAPEDDDCVSPQRVAEWLEFASHKIGDTVLVFEKLERLSEGMVSGHLPIFQCLRALALHKSRGGMVPGVLLSCGLESLAQMGDWYAASSSPQLDTLRTSLFTAAEVNRLLIAFRDQDLKSSPLAALETPVFGDWLFHAFGGHPELTHRAILGVIEIDKLRSTDFSKHELSPEWLQELEFWIDSSTPYSTLGTLIRIVKNVKQALSDPAISASQRRQFLWENQLILTQRTMSPVSAFAKWLLQKHEITVDSNSEAV